MSLSDVNLQIEECLLWKLIQFFVTDEDAEDARKRPSVVDNLLDLRGRVVDTASCSAVAAHDHYKSQLAALLADSYSAKYIFNRLQVDNVYMMLSVYKTPKMSDDLARIKASAWARRSFSSRMRASSARRSF